MAERQKHNRGDQRTQYDHAELYQVRRQGEAVDQQGHELDDDPRGAQIQTHDLGYTSLQKIAY